MKDEEESAHVIAVGEREELMVAARRDTCTPQRSAA